MEKEPQSDPSNDEDEKPSERYISEWLRKFYDLNDPNKPQEIRECANCGQDMQLLNVPATDDLPENQYFYCWYCGHVSLPDEEPFDDDDFANKEESEDED